MSTTLLRRAAAIAAAVTLLLAPRHAAAQDVETGPRRAPASVIGPGASPAADHDSVVPIAAAPVPAERGPLGEPAPSAVAATAEAESAPAPEAESTDTGPLGAPAPEAPSTNEGPLGAPAAEAPSTDEGPLGAPVRTPARRSFLPAIRVEARNAPVPLVGRPWGTVGEAFLAEQLTHERVVDAQLDAKFDLKALFAERGLTYPPRDLYFRLFKQEQVLEVWVRDAPASATYTLLREYPICAIPGRLGPKTRIDDFQAPEGFYYIEGFNPQSEYHLSLRLNYPNAADRVIGVEDSWGGDIYIHGGCSTVGCFPMTDTAMAELYWLAVEARAAGQTVIPVHVFPARLDEPTMRFLRTAFERDARLLAFWENLREGYDWFETQRRLPQISVDPTGRYLFAEPPASTPAASSADASADEPALLGEEVGVTPPAPAPEPSDSDAVPQADGADRPLGAEVQPATNSPAGAPLIQP